ncbi:putative hydrolase YraK [Catellatospora sp. TT07R-123]|uniref:alpha/beta fold hydrolase n=1 Tax=Catellatospora sp. TT07R-123 TaxID=2733863 RepID=UPI001B04929B|nr:alpha/beta hydrolase [Catellatospora sp. TT07R-123]GHJ44655.1 putative hydrolase YraK [Catellatospora sp. TT07R-123]
MTTTNAAQAATLSVPGAELYYEVRGTGPLLLISQSGEGDAGRSTDLVDRLAADYTVVTYDRRGLSRSVPADPARPWTMADHADDVHRLLAALTDRPARMLGCSLGAVIGMHLAVRHPEQLAVLVAHEPVAPRLLPPTEQDFHQEELRDLQRLYRAEGLRAALGQIAQVLGIDPANPDAEPGLTAQPMDARRVANFDVFIERDFTAVVDDVLDPAAVRAAGVPIVPAYGRTTPHHVFDHRCAMELAALLGTPAVDFPGGHNGNTTHPRAYARRLREVLGAAA